MGFLYPDCIFCFATSLHKLQVRFVAVGSSKSSFTISSFFMMVVGEGGGWAGLGLDDCCKIGMGSPSMIRSLSSVWERVWRETLVEVLDLFL